MCNPAIISAVQFMCSCAVVWGQMLVQEKSCSGDKNSCRLTRPGLGRGRGVLIRRITQKETLWLSHRQATARQAGQCDAIG